MPLPTVAATLRWKTKWRQVEEGGKHHGLWLEHPVETTVAIELAAS
jgi:hypothetical protein